MQSLFQITSRLWPFFLLFFLWGCNAKVEGLNQGLGLFNPVNDPASLELEQEPKPKPDPDNPLLCQHQDAQNYGEEESCLFSYCNDPYSTQYDQVYDQEIKDYINENGGAIETNEQACADTVMPNGFKGYYTVAEVYLQLQKFGDLYPDFAELFDIGQTVQGRPITCVKISTPEARLMANPPTYVQVGAHHAREWMASTIPTKITESVLERLTNDQGFYQLMSDRVMISCPVLNYDGIEYDHSNPGQLFWRKNRQPLANGIFGVDLNRNYSQGWGAGASTNPNSDVYQGPTPFSEPETQAFRDYAQSNTDIKAMISFHSFSALILYPMGSSLDSLANQARLSVYESWSNTMASFNNYDPKQASDLYVAGGDTCDYMELELGIYCVTFELDPAGGGAQSFYYPAQFIPSVLAKNLGAIYFTLENIHNMDGL
jgi:carboxypeptidase T